MLCQASAPLPCAAWSSVNIYRRLRGQTRRSTRVGAWELAVGDTGTTMGYASGRMSMRNRALVYGVTHRDNRRSEVALEVYNKTTLPGAREERRRAVDGSREQQVRWSGEADHPSLGDFPARRAPVRHPRS